MGLKESELNPTDGSGPEGFAGSDLIEGVVLVDPVGAVGVGQMEGVGW